MIGTLTSCWQYLGDELWNPLADHENAPFSLFSDLYAAAGERISPSPAMGELEEALSDPNIAREFFLSLSGSDFPNELQLVWFFDDIRKVISGYEIDGFVSHYLILLQKVLKKFNLRYRADIEITLRFLIHGSFSNLYAELERINSSDASLNQLMTEFEEAFDTYVRRQSSSHLKTIISKASNYLEGLASATWNKGSGGTLGTLAKQIGAAPHEKLESALVDVYKFCCDYPGIRHGGTPSSAKRELDGRDGIVASLLLFTFTAYLTSDMESVALLGT
jgi:hypothetical protein